MKHVFYFAKKIHLFSGKKLYGNLFFMMLISLFESVGILLLIPLIGLTGILSNISTDSELFNKLTIFFKGIPIAWSLLFVLTVYVVLIGFQSYFQRTQTILNTRIQQSFTRYLREETYKALLQANWNFFLKKRKTDLTNTMITEIARVSSGTGLFLQFISSLIFTSIQIGLALYLSIKMTVFVLVFGILLIYFSKNFIKQSNNMGNETLEISKTFLSGMTDQFNAIKDIKTNHLEDSHIKWFWMLNNRMENNMINIVKVRSLSQMIYKMISALLMASFIYLTVKFFSTQPAELMLIIVIFTRLWPRISGIQASMEQLGTLVPSFEALIKLQQECTDAKELSSIDLQSKETLSVEKGIECRGVSFRYTESDNKYSLQNINVVLPSNRMTAIVGKSGSGKSTLIDIILGLNKPDRGEVLIDGKLLNRDNLISLRNSISYVSQDPFLFNSSIRDNLLMINSCASEKDIWEALEFASAEEFVRKLPQGLDTIIGDRGVKLSGGERQRLVLARAILRKPAILVLDEATSALDSENEAKIQAAIDRLKGQMTIIVIAHRLSTIKNADQVIVLDQGKVIQQGGFAQLAVEQDGVFGNLLRRQMGAVL